MVKTIRATFQDVQVQIASNDERRADLRDDI